ncbi:MAG TPA: alpha/beta hydrolase [Candidatus Binataceae bacterium]|jgi:pimeloyl-ACP methyl ester carboxylesterase
MLLGEALSVLEAATSWLYAYRYPFPRVPRVLGKSILLIPGFMAGDLSLMPMASLCAYLGHRSEFGGILSNSRCPRETLELLGAKLERMYEREGEPVVVIGQSLGGVYARLLAIRNPEMIERVITLATPINSPVESSHPAISALAARVGKFNGNPEGCLTQSCPCGLALSDLTIREVPVTVVYSRRDGIVHWQSCVDRSGGPNIDHEEVISTHVAMGISADVCQIVADRLALPRRERKEPRPDHSPAETPQH